MFSKQDLDQIEEKGISIKEIENQLERFSKGFPSLDISEPAIIDNGILKLSKNEGESFVKKFEESDIDILKFVPASGAATRMFKDLYAFLDQFDDRKTVTQLYNENKSVKKFFADLEEFAFFSDLEKIVQAKHGSATKEILNSNKHNLIVEALLYKSGMNYGSLPKGLLKFHKYKSHERTAAQEQLAESLEYATKRKRSRIHFTVSPAHRELFESHIKDSIDELEQVHEIFATFSEQFQFTDTIAVSESFEPIRDESDNLLFRPSGHGALLSNLNQLDADLIFIKNIDNVVPDHLRSRGIRYKKILGGILLEYQERIFDLLRRSDKGGTIQEKGVELLEELGIKGDFSEKDVLDLLNRPIRVCGMVKNEGEPGGGPFWVRGKQHVSLQIVESAQVNGEDMQQLQLFKNGTHFNPVDIVCGVKNFKGQKFDLLTFRDKEAGFISEKSYNGEKLLAMELPGLWNGGMSNWNSVFVEVPQETFNPVKTVTDLLKPSHC